MSDQDPTTKPTLETLLEMVREIRDGVNGLTKRFDDLDVRVDRIESVVSQTRSEMLTLRADFKELRAELRDHFPAVK